MESMVVAAGSKSALEILQIIARRLGLATFELSERDQRLFARRKMADLAPQFPLIDISEAEILQIVEEVRAEYTAIDANLDFLLTGDNDLLVLDPYGKTRILKIVDYLEGKF